MTIYINQIKMSKRKYVDSLLNSLSDKQIGML